MSRQFARPMAYEPSMGQKSLQRRLSIEDSKKKAALDLGFDPSELADRGLEDDESFDEDDRASGAALVSRTTPLVSPGHHSNASSDLDLVSPHSASSRQPSDFGGGGDIAKLQAQLDMLKRVNGQLTKDKEHLTKQLQHARAGHAKPPPTAASAGGKGDNARVLQLLSDAERYIATLRESSCNYVDLLRKERELYHQGAPTVVQQLQKQLAEARRLAQSDRGASGAAKVPGVPQGSDAAAWKETCARLQAQLAEKDELIQMLQEEAEAADADAAEAEKDMKVAVEKLRAAEESRELANEQLKDLESAVAAQGEAGHGVQEHNRAMKKRDERIEELTSQLQAQKATIDKLHQLVQDGDEAAEASAAKVQALAAGKKELLSHLKKVKKAQAAIRVEAAAFSAMVSNDGWSVLLNHALKTSVALQGRIEQGAANRARQETAAEVEELKAQLKDAQAKWKTEHDRRKALHNEVLELKGNIRVFCRVRPLASKETAEGATCAVSVLDDECVQVMTGKGVEKSFEFNRCFAPGEPQEAVYAEVSSLVTSVVDGFNVCIMAYGQTGSGKTFTMEGTPSNLGVNSRALLELFDVSASRSKDFDIRISTSVLEIYNEEVRDLLSGSQASLSVRTTSDGVSPVDGLTITSVGDMKEVQAVLARGQSNRSTSATNMNEHSSRSHLVLSVYTTTTNKENGVSVTGKLHLVDLAGSERLSKTGATGDRLKEAQNINKSLSALGDVIAALQQRTKHVPYRNSKLTHLLQDSLGGNSKVLMFVNCSPASTNSAETLCSLNFAARASKVELGKASVNTAS